MPSYIHLVLQAGKDSLSRSMQNLAFRYTQATNRKLGRSGHLFRGRYKALLVSMVIELNGVDCLFDHAA
jgi:putative transposase